MKASGLVALIVAMPLAAVLGNHNVLRSAQTSGEPQGTNAPPLKATTVYVSDFELHAITRQQTATQDHNVVSSTSAGSRSSPEAQFPDTATTPPRPQAMIWNEDDSPALRAAKLVDFTSASLVEALAKAGYDARRLGRDAARPEQGVMLRGIFAEVDELNHIRRAILGAGSPAREFSLYVGVGNLARPDQPLYEIAPAAFPGQGPPDSRYGPVITVTSYAPVAKFMLAKNPSADDVKKIASQITGQLTALLRANPAAVTP